MQWFPLLRLDSPALRETLKCLDPFELFTISQCSKKIADNIKLAGTRNFHLSVNFDSEKVSINRKYDFKVKENSANHFGNYEMIGYRNFGSNEEKETVQAGYHKQERNSLTTFWGDKFIGLRMICIHLSKFFGCEIDSFTVSSELLFSKFRAIVQEIMKKQNGIQNLSLNTHVFTEKELKWTLDTVKVTEQLEITTPTSENFNYTFKTVPRFLNIGTTYWFKIDNLLSLDSCVKIVIWQSKFTNQDLGVFIKQWKNGKFPNLECLAVWSKEFNDDPIAGISNWRNPFNPAEKRKKINDFNYCIFEGVNVQRDDGVIGTFQLRDGRFLFLV